MDRKFRVAKIGQGHQQGQQGPEIEYPFGQEDISRIFAEPKDCLDLLNSEKSILLEKEKIYREKASELMDVAEHEQRMKLAPKKESSNMTTMEKLEILMAFLGRIKARLAEINASMQSARTVMPELVKKQRAVFEIMNHPKHGIETLKGEARLGLRRMLYSKIVAFSRSPFPFLGFNNTILMGGAGVGKTKVAKVLSFLYQTLGVFLTGNILETTSSDFIAEYVGQSGPKTQRVLWKSLEGVLFIDEAYALTPTERRSSHEESLTEIINFIDKNKGLFAIIAAGYRDVMLGQFLKANEGMPRRFPNQIHLKVYTGNDLVQLFRTFVNEEESKYRGNIPKTIMTEAEETIKTLYATEKELFDNQAGDIMNLASTIVEDYIMHVAEYDSDKLQNSFRKYARAKGFVLKAQDRDDKPKPKKPTQRPMQRPAHRPAQRPAHRPAQRPAQRLVMQKEDRERAVIALLIELGGEYLSSLARDPERKQHVVQIMDDHGIPKGERNPLLKKAKEALKS